MQEVINVKELTNDVLSAKVIAMVQELQRRVNGEVAATTETVEEIIFKDDSMTKIVHSIEEFLADEEKMLDLKNNEVAEANRDLYTNKSKYRYYVDCSIRREAQYGKVEGITETLNLVKISLGYKD